MGGQRQPRAGHPRRKQMMAEDWQVCMPDGESGSSLRFRMFIRHI